MGSGEHEFTSHSPGFGILTFSFVVGERQLWVDRRCDSGCLCRHRRGVLPQSVDVSSKRSEYEADARGGSSFRMLTGVRSEEVQCTPLVE